MTNQDDSELKKEMDLKGLDSMSKLLNYMRDFRGELHLDSEQATHLILWVASHEGVVRDLQELEKEMGGGK